MKFTGLVEDGCTLCRRLEMEMCSGTTRSHFVKAYKRMNSSWLLYSCIFCTSVIFFLAIQKKEVT